MDVFFLSFFFFSIRRKGGGDIRLSGCPPEEMTLAITPVLVLYLLWHGLESKEQA